jgi:hypothetical protein
MIFNFTIGRFKRGGNVVEIIEMYAIMIKILDEGEQHAVGSMDPQ